jgi:hypothetical protein
MKKDIKKYLAEIGSKGGKKSRRTLSPEEAKKMVAAREKKKKANKKGSPQDKEHANYKHIAIVNTYPCIKTYINIFVLLHGNPRIKTYINIFVLLHGNPQGLTPIINLNQAALTPVGVDAFVTHFLFLGDIKKDLADTGIRVMINQHQK